MKVPSLVAFATHPIQNQVPVWRELASLPGLDFRVIYASDFSVKGYHDDQFGRTVKWDQPLLSGYDYTVLGSAVFRNFLSLGGKGIGAALDRRGIDGGLICAYNPKFYLDAAWAVKRRGGVLLMRADLTDDDRRRPLMHRTVRDSLARILYRNIDQFCIVGEVSRRHLKRLGVGGDRISFSGYNVDDKLMNSQREHWAGARSRIRKELGCTSDDFVLLLPAKLIPKKDPWTLIRAIKKVTESGSIRLRLISMGDGALRSELEEFAQRELPGVVHFAGFVNQGQLGRYYVAADCVVLPSLHSETWGLVVNEAMHFGRPVIVSDRVGARLDLVRVGDTGIVFPAGDVAGLGEAIERAHKWILESRDRIEERCLETGTRYSSREAARGIRDAFALAQARRAAGDAFV